jgi:hypothetical protein
MEDAVARPRIQITPHLSNTEISQRYEDCQDEKVKNYWLAIQLLSDPNAPMPVEQVAEIVGFSADWIRKLARRYNRLGPAALVEDRHHRREKIPSRFS